MYTCTEPSSRSDRVGELSCFWLLSFGLCCALLLSHLILSCNNIIYLNSWLPNYLLIEYTSDIAVLSWLLVE